MKGIKFWMNFVFENSNKLPKNEFRKENALSVFTLGANNTCYLIYPWRKVVCFVIMISPKPRCFGLCYGTYHQKVLNEWGALTWFRIFGVTMWNLLIIEPFFHWISWKTKIQNYIGIWGHSWYCWKTFTKFDLIKLTL